MRHSDFKCFAFVSSEDNQVYLCHHYSLVQSSLWQTDSSTHVALMGLDNDAIPIFLAPASVRQAAKLLMPSVASLSKIDSPHHLLQLHDKVNDPTKLFFLCPTALFTYANARFPSTSSSTCRKSEIDPKQQLLIDSLLLPLFFVCCRHCTWLL